MCLLEQIQLNCIANFMKLKTSELSEHDGKFAPRHKNGAKQKSKSRKTKTQIED